MSVGLMVAPVFAGTIHVPGDSPTIQSAIQDAGLFDTIIVAQGTYFESINFGGKTITVRSEDPMNPEVVSNTIIDAFFYQTVVSFTGGEDENTVLDGLTIQNGPQGVFGFGTQATIRHCIIRDNLEGGITQSNGLIEDTQILNNNVGLADCNGLIRRCIIRNNRFNGLEECNGSITDSRIEKNGQSGVYAGQLEIVRCLIASNTFEGVIGPARLIDQSFIVGNRLSGVISFAGQQDGGIVRNSVIAGNRGFGFDHANKHVVNCTVVSNGSPGFVYHVGTIDHCIIWNNQGGQFFNSTTPTNSGSANPYVIQPGYWDEANGEWLNWDYHLSVFSPYIEAGDPNYPTSPNAATGDIEGNPRVVGSRVDIGAYEFQAACEGDDFDGDGTPDVCDRDIDGDGIPNVADVCDDTPLGVSVDDEGRPRADLNHDCKVDLRDYAIMQRDFFGP